MIYSTSANKNENFQSLRFAGVKRVSSGSMYSKFLPPGIAQIEFGFWVVQRKL